MSNNLKDMVDAFFAADVTASMEFPLVESGDYAVITQLNRVHATLHVTAILFRGTEQINTYHGITTMNFAKLSSAENKVAFLESEIANRTDGCKVASWLIDPIKDAYKLSPAEIMARIQLFVQVANLAVEYNAWAFKNKVKYVITYLKDRFPIKSNAHAHEVELIYGLGALDSKFNVLPISDYKEIGGVSIEIGATSFVFELQKDGSYIRSNKSSPIYKRSQLLKQLKV